MKFEMKKANGQAREDGIILINVLIFSAIVVTVVIALINWGAVVLRSTRNLALREQAFQIAEAGNLLALIVGVLMLVAPIDAIRTWQAG
mgnify:CR=1 FL=1